MAGTHIRRKRMNLTKRMLKKLIVEELEEIMDPKAKAGLDTAMGKITNPENKVQIIGLIRDFVPIELRRDEYLINIVGEILTKNGLAKALMTGRDYTKLSNSMKKYYNPEVVDFAVSLLSKPQTTTPSAGRAPDSGALDSGIDSDLKTFQDYGFE